MPFTEEQKARQQLRSLGRSVEFNLISICSVCFTYMRAPGFIQTSDPLSSSLISKILILVRSDIQECDVWFHFHFLALFKYSKISADSNFCTWPWGLTFNLVKVIHRKAEGPGGAAHTWIQKNLFPVGIMKLAYCRDYQSTTCFCSPQGNRQPKGHITSSLYIYIHWFDLYQPSVHKSLKSAWIGLNRIVNENEP